MFKIHINDGSEPIPSDDIMYIISKGGIFLKKKLGLFSSLAKVDSISILDDIQEYASMDIDKISDQNIGQIVTFFRDISKEFGEANIVLHYNQELGDYKIQVTEQKVTGASVDYTNEPFKEEGYIRIGTIHSHSTMSAFHSGTDHADETTFDGIHITLGNMSSEHISISASIMANGTRFTINPEDYIDGIELVEYEVDVKPRHYFIYDYNPKDDSKPSTKLGYKILTDGIEYPNEWLEKVEKKTYQNHQFGKVSTHQIRNQALIDGFEIWKGGDIFQDNKDIEWDPCMNCPYKSYKSEMMLSELLEDMDDDDLDRLGFNETDDGE